MANNEFFKKFRRETKFVQSQFLLVFIRTFFVSAVGESRKFGVFWN